MESPNDRTRTDRAPTETSAQAEPPVPKKRFRVEKIEERIAPKKGLTTHKGEGDTAGGEFPVSIGY